MVPILSGSSQASIGSRLVTQRRAETYRKENARGEGEVVAVGEASGGMVGVEF